MREATVIGGGLAGCEAALQLSSRKIAVKLIEMRPVVRTPAHRGSMLAELVCSNSLKSTDESTSSGLLKNEIRAMGCRLLDLAQKCSVPAGHALAVDREAFAGLVTETISEDPLIDVERSEAAELPSAGCVIVATGPLTSERMSSAIEEHFGGGRLFFYDAIAVSVESESIHPERLYRGSRYGKGGDDYLNLPLDKAEYDKIVEFLIDAPKAEKRGFESGRCFEGCLPIEVIAERGKDSLRYGPLKPKGLIDPATGKEPYAVLQLRQEKKDGSILGLVGFQTRLTRPAQRDLLRLLPGLEDSIVARWGAIHRNTYIDSPRLLDRRQMSKIREGLFFAGQLTGVEGYVESIAHGLICAINAAGYMEGSYPPTLPAETMIGALQMYLAEEKKDFQPMNANMGLLPPAQGNRKERKATKARRAMKAIREYIDSNRRFFP